MQPVPDDDTSTASPYRASVRWRLVLGILAIGLILGAEGGYYYARHVAATVPHVAITAEQLAAQDAAVRQSQAESRFLRAQLDTADGEIVVERAARKELEAQLRQAQNEIGQVRERLAFFEQLLPPGPEGTVDIRGAEVQREGQAVKYRVLLMRNGRSDAPFRGSLRFQASGILKGEAVSVDLAPMQFNTDDADSTSTDSATAESLLSLQFDQYQRSEGLLALPDGFVLESVAVSVLEGTAVRASRTIKLAF